MRMWSSPLFWICIAVALFWALGAYNRVMRLRSAVVQAFGSLDAHLVRLVALLGEFGASQASQVSAGERLGPELAALQGATTQLSACLAVARAQPLGTEAQAALSAAHGVLQVSWHKLLEASPEASEAVPPPLRTWSQRWDEHAVATQQARDVHVQAVDQYNAAVRQFPASVLARIFGFRPTRGL